MKNDLQCYVSNRDGDLEISNDSSLAIQVKERNIVNVCSVLPFIFF